MPDVVVKTKEAYFQPIGKGVSLEHHSLFKFTHVLPIMVASVLTIPGKKGHLQANDIEVEFKEFGKFDVHQADVEVVVMANYYAKRAANLEERRKQLEDLIVEWIRDEKARRVSNLGSTVHKISTWIPLVGGGAYGEAEV